MRTVLVVDDSGYFRTRIRKLLEEEGFTSVVEAADGDEALHRFEAHHPDLILLDQVMRGKEGIEVSRLLKERDPLAQIVILTVLSDPDIHFLARKAGALAVINKSDPESLRTFLRSAREKVVA
ncbi:MAG: response regulator [Acidobacteria bacterium]|nr:response regulator [Acidobacteriota bacterium]MCG3192205.1 putative transcriptional regulatory protein pdtaR [Thermoanaerobaculia bacterium]MCK6683524.1 response regulator [Thermoanaerobaculia bacterium]